MPRTRTPLRENLSNAGTEAIRVRLDVGYDGSGFSGWARQPGQRTVQETLEGALARVLRLPESLALTVAGRTDAGVHARGQVAHCDVPAAHWAAGKDTALRRLARLLPPDMRVHRISPAPAGFDARFSAICAATPTGSATMRPRPTRWPVAARSGTATGSTSRP